jgi:hypothetical protein
MTEAYPLRWPDGWPKTPAADRAPGAQFRRGGYNGTLPTFSSGRKDVLDELEKMGVTICVISSSVDVRVDGIPRLGVNADSRSFKEPGVALYFSLKGRPFVMAQDAYSSPGVNLRSLALALEAMRALERHGGGTMAGKAFDGFAALPPPAGMKPKRPWWQVLRYSENPEDRELLSVGEVKARFNTLAKRMHPDSGGDSDDLSELTMARDEAVAELGGSEQ